jgi:hypothetical protein
MDGAEQREGAVVNLLNAPLTNKLIELGLVYSCQGLPQTKLEDAPDLLFAGLEHVTRSIPLTETKGATLSELGEKLDQRLIDELRERLKWMEGTVLTWVMAAKQRLFDRHYYGPYLHVAREKMPEVERVEGIVESFAVSQLPEGESFLIQVTPDVLRIVEAKEPEKTTDGWSCVIVPQLRQDQLGNIGAIRMVKP